jgi:hypothetical protein
MQGGKALCCGGTPYLPGEKITLYFLAQKNVICIVITFRAFLGGLPSHYQTVENNAVPNQVSFIPNQKSGLNYFPLKRSHNYQHTSRLVMPTSYLNVTRRSGASSLTRSTMLCVGADASYLSMTGWRVCVLWKQYNGGSVAAFFHYNLRLQVRPILSCV